MAHIAFETFHVHHLMLLVFFVFSKPFRTLAACNYSNTTFVVRNLMTILSEQRFKWLSTCEEINFLFRLAATGFAKFLHYTYRHHI